jgi:hypothetical protein
VVETQKNRLRWQNNPNDTNLFNPDAITCRYRLMSHPSRDLGKSLPAYQRHEPMHPEELHTRPFTQNFLRHILKSSNTSHKPTSKENVITGGREGEIEVRARRRPTLDEEAGDDRR